MSFTASRHDKRALSHAFETQIEAWPLSYKCPVHPKLGRPASSLEGAVVMMICIGEMEKGSKEGRLEDSKKGSDVLVSEALAVQGCGVRSQ